MAWPTAAPEHYREQQRLTLVALAATRRTWDDLGADFGPGWRRVGPRLVLLVSAAQLASARNGARFVPRVLEEQGVDASALAEVDVSSLVGVASDGRPLDSLLYRPVIAAKSAVADGATVQQARASGRNVLDRIVATQVADAGRVAAGVATTVRPAAQGHVRLLNAPSCKLCVGLAGSVYRWSSGFYRHPGCDCVMVPVQNQRAAEREGLVADPLEAIRRGEVTGLTQAERDAILRDGADVSRVINATTRQGAVYTAGGRAFTREAAGRTPRPTPDQIYRDAVDREDAVRLLRRHGYIT